MYALVVALTLVPSPDYNNDIGPGNYDFYWGQLTYAIKFKENGTWVVSVDKHEQYHGLWKYNKSKRILHMVEMSTQYPQNVPLIYHGKLDATMKGEFTFEPAVNNHYRYTLELRFKRKR